MLQKNKIVYASVVLYKTSAIEVHSVLKNLCRGCGVSQIIVVDNSPNNDLFKICDEFSNVKYIFNPSNPGYGAGHNIAIALAVRAGADYHLVSNSDVFFKNNILEHLIRVCSDNPQVGIIAPAINDINGKLQYSRKRIPNIFDMLIRAFLPYSKNNSRSRYYEMRDIFHRDPIIAPYLSGCFMMLNLVAIKSTIR